jgi:hypothetical protein
MIEIRPDQLPHREIFGPTLHVARYHREKLDVRDADPASAARDVMLPPQDELMDLNFLWNHRIAGLRVDQTSFNPAQLLRRGAEYALFRQNARGTTLLPFPRLPIQPSGPSCRLR